MRWYRVNGRHGLPWRLTHDLYAVLVSEVMLQQTQVERVQPYFEAWMHRWPTAPALAAADPADVIRQWAGLGYNRRAVNLQAAARAVAANGFPSAVEELARLPGIGRYTASAVASFAFGQRVSIVETNIARLLGRCFMGKASRREVPGRGLERLADRLLPARNARDHNLALMDLGATVCTARAPRCPECPLRARCQWRQLGYPVERERRDAPQRFESTARFARGRIVAALRDQHWLSSEEIEELLPEDHRPRAASYLSALARDGLVVARQQGWSLPGESGQDEHGVAETEEAVLG